NGEQFSFVEANFYVEQNENAMDGNIIVSREIHSSGRNSCKINGRLVTVSQLKEFMNQLLDIHGQHDSQLILEQTEHIHYLDRFIGSEIVELLKKYQTKLTQYQAMKQELKNTYGEEKEKERKLDLLHYQLNEIKQAKLKKEEET